MPQDLDAVLAWQEHEASLCGGCGHPLHESTSAELEGAYDVTALACHACAAREQASAKHRDQHGVKLHASLSDAARRYLDDLKEG